MPASRGRGEPAYFFGGMATARNEQLRALAQRVADALAAEFEVISLGWDELGDLSVVGDDKKQMQARAAQTYPALKPGAVPKCGRCVAEVRVPHAARRPGGLSAQAGQHVELRRITGPYFHQTRSCIAIAVRLSGSGPACPGRTSYRPPATRSAPP
jgi:hypothetical protein